MSVCDRGALAVDARRPPLWASNTYGTVYHTKREWAEVQQDRDGGGIEREVKNAAYTGKERTVTVRMWRFG